MPQPHFRDRWPGQATIEDAHIHDRRAYEHDCLAYLEAAPDLIEGRNRRGFTLIEAQLRGQFPNTTISVRLRIPAVEEEVQEEWPIWRDGGAIVRDGSGIEYRWTPRHLVQNHLQPLIFEA